MMWHEERKEQKGIKVYIGRERNGIANKIDKEKKSEKEKEREREIERKRMRKERNEESLYWKLIFKVFFFFA